jgi:hypothetical protein
MAAPRILTLFGTRREWTRDLLVATAAGAFLAIVGPFGSYLNGDLPLRLAYWIGGLWIGMAMFALIMRPAMALAPRWHVPRPLAAGLATIIAALPIALLCRPIGLAFWPDIVSHISPLTWYGQTLVIALPLALGYQLHDRRRQKPALAVVPTGSFRDRLPAHLGRDLLALQMEDHYVRAHTSKGSALILIPLHQAINELRGVPGLRVHRSWWVARAAVVSVVRDGRNLKLRLSNEIEAPVARASVAELRAAGWLETEITEEKKAVLF